MFAEAYSERNKTPKRNFFQRTLTTFTYLWYVHDKLKQDNNICVMLWAFWYHLLDLKNVKNTHG